MRARVCVHTALVVGSQAFYQASTFNANIGAWNTASVTSLASVCAASARRAHRAIMSLYVVVLPMHARAISCAC
jgi:hypothetical protein